jgi:ankyrin repeat protein
MYHTHEATEPLDMVYALLGMCSDIKDLSRAGIEPNYMVEWRLLIDRFVQALFQQQASIIGWNKREMPVIEAKGFILGTVLEIGSKSNTYTGETQNLKVKIYQPTDRIADTEPKELWTLRGSATPIRAGDIICFLHGATRPTIIRAYGTFFRIITVAPNSPQPINSGMPLHFTRNLLLLWDWKISLENSQTHDECDVLIEMAGGQLKYETARDGPMETAVRLWNVAQILGDVARILKNRRAIEEVERARQTAALLFQQIVAEGHFHSQKCQCGRIPLLWAAEIGYKEVTNLILTQRGVDPNLRDYAGRTPLLWAAMGGHEAIVRLLLKSDVSVEADSTEYYGRTPLSYAAEGGHNAVTKLLLDSGLVKADSADYSGRTPLSYAAEGGHNAVTKLLLDSDLVKADSEAHDGRTPLSYAMGCGHEVIVGLLLGSDLVKADSTDHSGRTPLSYAAEGGHNAVTKLLLDSDLVKADLKDYSGRTPLSYAAEGGHIGVTRLLLDSDFVKVDSKDLNGRTSLSYAAEGGHNAVTRLLLDSELVNVDSKDYSGRVPLSYASEGGHESVVRLLLDSNLVEVDYKDYEGRTPLSFASEGGHETIMRLLQHFNAV